MSQRNTSSKAKHSFSPYERDKNRYLLVEASHPGSPRSWNLRQLGASDNGPSPFNLNDIATSWLIENRFGVPPGESFLPLHSTNTQNSSGSGAPPMLPSPFPFSQDILGEDDADAHTTHITAIGEGSFANAHDIKIGTAYMIDYNRTGSDEGHTEDKKLTESVLVKLAAKGMPSAMLESKERAYAPRCNEDTHQTLRDEIAHWVQDDAERPVLWLWGPAAVGKSAVAQTVAEDLKKEGLLGAVFFFSRPNNRSNPDVVIPTLVYQLAQLLPEYRRTIVQCITADPLILDKSRRVQFKELIIKPFLATTFHHQPLLIVLDGLDECNDRKAQCEFVEMISLHVWNERNLGLRWMICSRPEPDLKAVFSSRDSKAICRQQRLVIDDEEARNDVLSILWKGFEEIRERYPDQLAKDWPVESQVRFIADRASGHHGFASFILRFIGDRDYDDPSGRLEVCLRFLNCAGGENANPLRALDLLYTQILSDVPIDILPTTQRILGLIAFYGARLMTNIALANFLGLDQASFYRALRHLHSVVFVPPAEYAHSSSIQVYHKSFIDYLKDPTRSGKFVLDERVLPCLDVALSSLKWLSYARKTSSEPLVPELTWNPPGHGPLAVQPLLESLCRFSFKPCWTVCPRVPNDSLMTLIEALERFDFNLDYRKWRGEQTRDFAYFIRWLVTLGVASENLVIVYSRNPNLSSGEKTVTRVHHKDDSPDAFVVPFLATTLGLTNKIYLQLGRYNPALFCLEIHPEEMRISPCFVFED
ncbi:hypothetical protein D9756_010035 [Leucocoprinus leucothites]|uniref:Nephrocystin 3-like N-terminal domain-containing protein n=1 Tax=Leucocoprinus leucothites TaxID=201217 RepID=A0A8H5FRK0_9AGAR|nr:hypothetical protein D9756_010035 [Leucoagaricus leucothites]